MSQRTHGRNFREINRGKPLQRAGSLNANHQAGRCRFHIPLYPRHLSGKKEPGICPQAEIRIQQLGRIQVCVFMHHAVTHKLRIFQTGDHTEHPFLFRPFQVGLESYQIVQRARRVVLPKLYDRVGFLPRSGIPETNGLQRPETHGVLTPVCHLFNGHAAFKHIMFKIFDFSSFRFF